MKSRKLERAKRISLVGVVAAGFLAGIVPSLPVFASGSGGSPGGGDSACGDTTSSFGAVCNSEDALTWVYYTFDYSNATSQSFNFPGNTRSVGTSLIKSCPVGFWHLGYHVSASATRQHTSKVGHDGDWYYRHNGDDWDRTGAINFHGNDYGQVGSRNTRYTETVDDILTVWDPGSNIDSESAKIRGTQLRESWDGGKSVTAQKFGKPSDVEADFERAKNSGLTFYDADGDAIGGTVRFGELAWFCYDDGMNKTTYTGSTDIYDGGTSKGNNYTISNIGANSKTITFKHSIHRNNDGPNSADNEQYYVNSDPSGYAVGSSSSPSSESFGKNKTKEVASKSIEVTLAPGETKTIWQTLHYESSSQSNGPDATPDSACTLMGGSIHGRYCAKLSRNAAKFTGSVAAKVNGAATNNGATATTSSSDAGSYTVQFNDVVTRSSDGAGGTASADWSTGITANGSSVSYLNGRGNTGNLSEGASKTVKSYDGYSYSDSLNFGQTHTVCNALSYYKTISVSGNETDYKSICVNIYRKPAKFTGSVEAKVNGAVKSNDSTTTITSEDGSYTVSFQDKVSRNADGAGGTASSNWSTSISKNSSTISSKNANGTVSLGENGSNTVKAHSDYTYSGTLKYGETQTICNSMTYNSVISVGGNSNDTKSICVKVKRDNAKCDVDNEYTYGIYTAKNIARLGAENKSLGVTRYSNTKLNNTTPSSEISIYARPTDLVRFHYNMCAGSLYPIKENPINGKTVSFTASGSSSKNNANGNPYLFRKSVPLVGDNFNNPRTWSSSSASSGFLSSSTEVQVAYKSPSSGVDTNYRCGYMSSDDKGYYQIAGKEGTNCARSGVYNIGTLDTGSTITQKLTWNEQPVTNGTTVGDAPRSATANIVIPYNYELKPYVTISNSSTNVAYIGETIKMYPGVAVMTRKNTTVSSDNSKNNYATITKNTEVKYNYYFTDYAGRLKGSVNTARATETRRFNKEGFITSSANEQLNQISIEIDDSHAVGDRVCVEISVYPFESHDGTNNAAVALKETSDISTRRATASCMPIAKRPTISIESSNVYSATNINTSYYAKKTAADNGVQKQFYFGSWSEYGVFGRVNKSFLMSSGAAFGYIRDVNYDNKSLNIVRTNPQHDYKVSQPNNSNECTFMTQTFANSNCEQGDDAKVIGGIAADQFESRMTERYKGGNTQNLSGVTQKQFANTSYLDASTIDPADTKYYDATVNYASIRANDIYLSRSPSFANGDTHNHTIVFNAKNVVIDGDINKEIAKEMTSLNNVTGIVILADNVYLTDAVKYVNAIIIAKNVNTCAFKSSDPTKKLEMSDLNSGVCTNSVIFDQPVITKRLVLNRTAGATSGTGSIVRAEVFNLNSGNFLWSFGQMSRYNQAITTYSRELPPRY